MNLSVFIFTKLKIDSDLLHRVGEGLYAFILNQYASIGCDCSVGPQISLF